LHSDAFIFTQLETFFPSLLAELRFGPGHPMQRAIEQSNPFLNRRQFGRRETSRGAVATIAGNVAISVVIRNISEGGALLSFPDGFVPDKPFRLAVDKTDFNLFCEVRHHGAYGVGVRFLNSAEGNRLMNHLYPEQTASGAEAAHPNARMEETQPSGTAISNRELRQMVLAWFTERTAVVHQEKAGTKTARPITLRLRKQLSTSFALFKRASQCKLSPEDPAEMESGEGPPAASDTR